MRSEVSRRAVLQAAMVPILARVSGPADIARPAIRPREEWAGSLAPLRPLDVERRRDVKFLLVHHSATPNNYDRADVPATLRGFYRLHTGPKRRWPDIAYNFLVDRFGQIWEGRAGSLHAPVKGDASGGSQGHALLCCFIGDHTSAPPTQAAVDAMTRLLAWLADRYDIETRPDAVTTFVSRGSSKWPAGTSVTTTTIAGHRDMSRTTCPGDAAYALVRETFPTAVTAARRAVASTPPRVHRDRVTPSPSPPPGRQAHDASVERWSVVAAAAAMTAGAAVAMSRRGRATSHIDDFSSGAVDIGSGWIVSVPDEAVDRSSLGSFRAVVAVRGPAAIALAVQLPAGHRAPAGFDEAMRWFSDVVVATATEVGGISVATRALTTLLPRGSGMALAVRNRKSWTLSMNELGTTRVDAGDGRYSELKPSTAGSQTVTTHPVQQFANAILEAAPGCSRVRITLTSRSRG